MWPIITKKLPSCPHSARFIKSLTFLPLMEKAHAWLVVPDSFASLPLTLEPFIRRTQPYGCHALCLNFPGCVPFGRVL